MREEKRQIKKGKLIIVGIILLVIVAIIIFNVIKKDDTTGDKDQGDGKESTVYDLPDITYSDMQVTDVEMEYLADNNETMVSFLINNTTENLVQNESLTAYLIDANEETIGQTKTYIATLAPGEQYSISVILKGNLTTTTQIKLQKEQSTAPTSTTPTTNTTETNTTETNTTNTAN